MSLVADWFLGRGKDNQPNPQSPGLTGDKCRSGQLATLSSWNMGNIAQEDMGLREAVSQISTQLSFPDELHYIHSSGLPNRRFYHCHLSRGPVDQVSLTYHISLFST